MATITQMQVLSEIRSSPRQHISVIAEKLGIPRSTAHGCYKAAMQYIKKCTALIGFEELGYSLRINFTFRIKNNKIINNLLLKHANVNSIYKVNNKNTLCVECYFTSMAGAYRFKEMLQDNGIKRIAMCYIIKEIAREKLLL